MKVSLLISTYNWPESLELVLKSALKQTVSPFEILIADDGSNDETKLVIENFKKISKVPVLHIWQKDKGFRKAKILNKAIAKTNSQYIIQIDGDCIIHKKFIEDHIKASRKGVYLYGSRINILPKYVSEILINSKIEFNFTSKEIKNRTRCIYWPFLASYFKIHNHISKKFRGCNVSYWREDFIAVNGYNEDFEGWGREDSDLVIRMGNNGIKSKRLRYTAILFHIYHNVNSKEKLDFNDKMQSYSIFQKTICAKKGINKYL